MYFHPDGIAYYHSFYACEFCNPHCILSIDYILYLESTQQTISTAKYTLKQIVSYEYFVLNVKRVSFFNVSASLLLQIWDYIDTPYLYASILYIGINYILLYGIPYLGI